MHLPPSPPTSAQDSSDDAISTVDLSDERKPHDPQVIKSRIIDEARKVLLAEADAIAAMADRLQTSQASADGYHEAVYLLFRCVESGGKIIVTGVGKSGKIGQKMVASLQSLGSCAAYLDPVEAMHGDFGLVAPNDAVVALSNSGNTEELLRILPGLKHRRVPLIAICGQETSQLAKAADAWVDAFVATEACDYVPAPTNSTTLALAIGDAIALSLSQLRAFTAQGFAMNHPGGSLGRRLLLKVKDCMFTPRDIPMVAQDATLQHVMRENSTHHKIGAVLVVDKDRDLAKKRHHSHHKLIGIITNSDIRKALELNEGMFSLRARDIMTTSPLVADLEDMAIDAKSTIDEKNVSALPVLDTNDLVKGLVTLHQLQELF